MATKIKKGYDVTAKERKEGRPSKDEQDQKNLEKRDLPIAVDEATVSAPIGRRLLAYIIDLVLCFSGTAIMLTAAADPSVTQLSKLLYMFSAVALQLLMFGIVSTEYWPGQTIGRKILNIYVRRIDNKKTLGIGKNLLRDYVYGALGALLTIPFEVFSMLMQLFGKATIEEEDSLQAFTFMNRTFKLPRDMIFKDEVVYLPKTKRKTKKEQKNDV